MRDTSQNRVLIIEPKHNTTVGRPQLLRIEFAKDYTKIDFGYQATSYYVKGGWVKISKKTFLREKNSKVKYALTHAENIPIAPVHHHFKTVKDWLYFSLVFEPLKFKSCVLEMVEAEKGDSTGFNYYDIKIDTKEGMEIIESSNH